MDIPNILILQTNELHSPIYHIKVLLKWRNTCCRVNRSRGPFQSADAAVGPTLSDQMQFGCFSHIQETILKVGFSKPLLHSYHSYLFKTSPPKAPVKSKSLAPPLWESQGSFLTLALSPEAEQLGRWRLTGCQETTGAFKSHSSKHTTLLRQIAAI